jgi:NAD(P) transhydrogenase subunit beta
MSDPQTLIVDLVVLVFFLMGIARFRSPESARAGSILIALTLLLGAVVIVLARRPLHAPAVVLVALAVGAVTGGFAARRVTMTRIPAMVAFQNGAGGLAAALVSFVELTREPLVAAGIARAAGLLGLTIGAMTFSGSLIAGAKLANLLRQTPSELPRHGWILCGTLTAILILACWDVAIQGVHAIYFTTGIGLLAVLAGVVLAIRVGGADMPVLISFLNALSGLAAAFCGVTVANRLLIACGATVAASGFILTHAMCRAMNRRWQAVLLGTGTPPTRSRSPTKAEPGPEPPPPIRPASDKPEATPLATAIDALRAAHRILLIPGYGMALANAQVPTVQLANRLKEMGKDVRFAIHPIAGRMPGHMHVLLAEAEVDSDMLVDLEDINPEFAQTDLAIVVGACDVINPAAIHVPGTPISGMPILSAHEAKRVLVCNLDRRPGYSGVDNPLYQAPKTILLLGDASANLRQLLDRLR